MSTTTADFDVARIDGKWLITNMVGGTTVLEVWTLGRGTGVPGRPGGAATEFGHPIVKAVARLPANVRTKLLIAFVGTALLLVAVGLLGLGVLGQSNDRVASVGPLQERAVQYSQLQAEAEHLRGVLSANVAKEFSNIWRMQRSRQDYRDVLAGRRPIRRRRGRADRGAHGPGSALVHAASERPEDPGRDQERGRDALEIARAGDHPPLRERGHHNLERDRELREEMLPLRADAEELATDLYQDAADLAHGTRAEVEELIASQRELLRELARAVHRRRRGGDRARAAARVRPLVVGDRADPDDRRSPRRDRVGRLLGARGGRQSRRARRAGRQRQPDERRAAAPLHRARGGESAQVGVPGQHVPRAADAARRDHRLLAGAAGRDGRPGEREASRVPR